MELYAHAMNVFGQSEWPTLKEKIEDPAVAAACKAYVDAVLKLKQADEELDQRYFCVQGTELERIIEQTRILNDSTSAQRNKDRTWHGLMVALLGEDKVHWALADEDEELDEELEDYEDYGDLLVDAMY
jgi:hypothetical protein